MIGGLLALVLGIVAVELAPGWDDPAPAGPTVRGAADCPEGMTVGPGGRFVMGSAPGDEVPKNEIPQHEVEVAPFCLDTTEVTVAA